MTSETTVVTAGGKSSPPARRSATDRHLEFALELLRAGRRPTLDMLVAENGGSRTTAQQALTALWAEHLPALLLEADSDNTLPDAVRSALMSVWTQAMKEAQAIASAALADEQGEVQAAWATIQAQTEALKLEQEAVDLSLAEAERRVQEAEAQLAKEREKRQVAQEEASDARDRAESLAEQLAKSGRALSDASAAMARLEEQRKRDAELAREALDRSEAGAERALNAARADAAQMRAELVLAHEKAIGTLKEAYVDSEARLRVELDAQKTRAKQLEREHESLRQHNVEQTSRISELEVSLKNARTARRPWRRGATKGVMKVTPTKRKG